jgi:hypothetical protein
MPAMKKPILHVFSVYTARVSNWFFVRYKPPLLNLAVSGLKIPHF